MDNAQKAIMIGVGLFITIIIISAVLLIVNLGTGLVDDATSNLSSISSTLQNSILQNYDNKIVTGTQVRSALQQYMTSEDVSVVLANNEAELVAGVGRFNLAASDITLGSGVAEVSATDYEDADEPTVTSIAAFTNVERGSDMFVPTTRQYESYIINTSDTMVGILFVPQDATLPEDGILSPAS